MTCKQEYKDFAKELRIDTCGWSINCSALFNEVSTKCSLLNYYILDIIR